VFACFCHVAIKLNGVVLNQINTAITDGDGHHRPWHGKQTHQSIHQRKRLRVIESKIISLRARSDSACVHQCGQSKC
jgi:hypothetical protein